MDVSRDFGSYNHILTLIKGVYRRFCLVFGSYFFVIYLAPILTLAFDHVAFSDKIGCVGSAIIIGDFYSFIFVLNTSI